MIDWIVDKFHVSLSDREVIRNFRGRCKKANKLSFSDREFRKGIYRAALSRHHHNIVTYQAVMSGRFTMRCKSPCIHCGD